MSDIDKIIDRMIQAAGAKNAAEMTKLTGLSSGAVSQWKKRGSVPDGSVARVAAHTNVRFEWIKNGEGDMYEEGQGGLSVGLDKDLVRVVIEAVEEGLNDLQLELKPDKKAQLVITLCEMFQEEKQVDKPTILKLIKLAA